MDSSLTKPQTAYTRARTQPNDRNFSCSSSLISEVEDGLVFSPKSYWVGKWIHRYWAAFSCDTLRLDTIGMRGHDMDVRGQYGGVFFLFLFFFFFLSSSLLHSPLLLLLCDITTPGCIL